MKQKKNIVMFRENYTDNVRAKQCDLNKVQGLEKTNKTLEESLSMRTKVTALYSEWEHWTQVLPLSPRGQSHISFT